MIGLVSWAGLGGPFSHIGLCPTLLPAQNALKAAGINPSANKKFSTDDVKAAIRDMYGVDALIHCGQGQQLTEVGISRRFKRVGLHPHAPCTPRLRTLDTDADFRCVSMPARRSGCALTRI